MNKTKEAISSFMSKAGHHDTTVHESVNPAVQHETVRPSQHEEVNTAVDREVHQDHYHHTVQPVQDREVLAEQHHHNIGQTEHRTLDHRDESKTKRALETEAAKWKDESRRTDTTYTQSHAPTIEGEHVHHHVHETYQPVIHKETVEPHVVHTTVPIHETHHNEAKHHATSTLPAVSLSEFKKHGGTHTGGQHEHHQFEGCPDVEGGAHSHNKGLANITHSSHGNTTGVSEGQTGPHSSRMANTLDPRVDSDRDGSRTVGGSRTTGTAGTTGMTGSSGTTGASEGQYGPHSSRLANASDPRVDSDRDGRSTRATGNTLGTQGGSNISAQNAATAAMSGKTHARNDSGKGLNDYESGTNNKHSTDSSQEPSILSKVLNKVNSNR
ncbi:allergen [Seiridium cupressi]